MREPSRNFCTRWSCQKFCEDGIGNCEVFLGEAQAIAFQIEETLGAERVDLAADGGESFAGAVCVGKGVAACDLCKIDAVELAKAQEKFFFESLLGSDWLDLLAWGNSLLDHGDVLRRIVDIGPARLAVEGMRACT
jgi:hypothetical protein